MIHIVFWFLAPEWQVRRLSGKEVMDMLEANDATPHSPPSREFEGWSVLTMRLRPPEAEEWKRRYGVDVIGITAGLEEMFPYSDLVAAIAANRVEESRKEVRVGGVTRDEAVRLLEEKNLFGSQLRVSQFQTDHRQESYWAVWYNGSPQPEPEGIIVREDGMLKIKDKGAISMRLVGVSENSIVVGRPNGNDDQVDGNGT